MRFIYHNKYYVIFLMCFLFNFHEFLLFLSRIKICKDCNKNDKIKLTLLYGSYMGFSVQTHMGMPISVLNGANVGISMWVYPERSQMGHT